MEEHAVSAQPLTQARVDDLEPRKTVHTLRDGALEGFGVRVLPSGRKRFDDVRLHGLGGGIAGKPAPFRK